MMGRRKAYPVTLSDAEREQLQQILRAGSHPAQHVRRTRILLELDENHPGRQGPAPSQKAVAVTAGVHHSTVENVARAYAARGGDVMATISRKKRLTPPVAPTVTGEVEARIIALSCTEPPEGYDRWSLRLLEKHVKLTDEIPDVDHSTIGRVLKKGACART